MIIVIITFNLIFSATFIYLFIYLFTHTCAAVRQDFQFWEINEGLSYNLQDNLIHPYPELWGE